MKTVTVTKKKVQKNEEDYSILEDLKMALEDLRHGRIKEI